MKVIIAGDIHAHKYRSFNQDGQRLGNIIQLIEELFELAHKYSADIWLSGDLFNTMQLIQTETVVAVTSVFNRMGKKYPTVKVITISGNHDYATRNSIEKPAVSAIDALAELSDNVVLIDNKSYTGDGFVVHGVPYYDDPKDLRTALGMVLHPARDKHFLLMHQSVGSGIDMVPDDIDPKDLLFTPFDMIFNGHIHGHSNVTKNFINVGSPLHRDAGDIGKDKGVLLFDTTTLEVERILLNYPQYRKLDEGAEVPEEWKDDYIVWVPKQIEIAVEEEEIREKFDHANVTKEGMIENYIKIKLTGEPGKLNGKRIYEYGKTLLDYAG